MLKDLIKFGLPEKEACLYLALLELGPSSVTPVAKRAKVPRTNAYHLLNSLVAKGLVSFAEDKKKTKMLFSAAPPKQLVRFLSNKVEEYEQLKQRAEELIPELESVYGKQDNKLQVRFYDGVEGVVNAYEDTLTSKTEICAYASTEYRDKFFPGYFPNYYARRTKRGIPVRCFLADTKESRRVKSLDKSHLSQTCLVPARYAVSPEVNIYDDKVVIISLKEKFAAIIESQEVADAFRKMFELAFERAEEYDKELC